MHHARIFDRIGWAVSRHWFAVLLAWAVLLAVTVRFAPRWDDVTKDGDFAYLPAAMTSVQGERLLEEAFPEALSKSQAIFVVCRSNGPLQQRDYDVADRLVEEYTPGGDSESPILGVLSHQTEVVGEKLKSPVGPQGQALLIVLQLRNEFAAVANMDLLSQIHARLDALRRAADFPPGLEIGLTGSAAAGSDMLFAAEESIRNTERATIVLVIVILAFIWLWRDTSDTERISALAQSTFWFVLPSLPLFLVLPVLLRSGAGFWASLGLSCLVTVLLYAAMVWTLGKLGVTL